MPTATCYCIDPAIVQPKGLEWGTTDTALRIRTLSIILMSFVGVYHISQLEGTSVDRTDEPTRKNEHIEAPFWQKAQDKLRPGAELSNVKHHHMQNCTNAFCAHCREQALKHTSQGEMKTNTDCYPQLCKWM